MFNQFEQKREWWRVYEILQYAEMECDCAKKITERLFREYGALTANTFVYESPMTVSKILYTLAGAPPPLHFRSYASSCQANR
jgi:hypothetical protein